MYAIIQTGGKQYKVQEGEVVRIEKLPGEEGQAVNFNHILFFSNQETVKIGAPLVEGAKVEAEILKNDQDKKVIVFKKKRRKGFAKKQGHRQEYTEVKILKIHA
ncbi:MAG: 50S ribosomal protein L21 [Deltaproteobacteria bacterium]|nr:50S ribosomal protein L21 [Deltaproteobacteria bacterium]